MMYAGHGWRMTPEHRHTPEEEKRIRDAALDRTIEATFPASDSPSSLPNPDDDDAIQPRHDDADTAKEDR